MPSYHRIYRKYKNRRLYGPSVDTPANTKPKQGYVTLATVRSHICAGGTIEVIDDRTGTDVTSQVLMQIWITVATMSGTISLTSDQLHQIIRQSHA